MQTYKMHLLSLQKQLRMPNLPRIKSSQRRLIVLLAFTFLVGTMLTIVNYNQNIVQQRFVISDDRTALLNYFKYSHLKRNLISDTSNNKPTYDKNIKTFSSSDLRSLNRQSNQLDQNNKLIGSTTFSDEKKESSTKFLISRDNRDVNKLDSRNQINNDNQLNHQNDHQDKRKEQKDKLSKLLNNNNINNDVDKSISNNKITPSPIQSDKASNLTVSNLNQLQSGVSWNKQSQITLVVNKPPSFVHSEAELNLTQRFLIDKKNFCSKDHGYGVDLLVMVITSPANFDARNAIRQTWGGFAVERGSRLLFVVGRSPLTEINDRIKEEDNQYEDILQAQFQDAYYNLTLKSLSIINWVADNCEKAKYVLKIDDDMFVNMQLLIDFAETREFKNVIIGKIAKKWLPHRDSNSKWYVPSSAYSGQVYPNFATGPAYLIHREAIPNLAKVIRSNTTKVIKLEDVFLAGIVAEKAGVRRLNYSLFKNAYFEVNKCNFMRFITSHQHSPKEIIRLWQVVYSDKKVDCNVKKAAVTKAPVVSNKKAPVQVKPAEAKKSNAAKK